MPSLVGSEMCIRDSIITGADVGHRTHSKQRSDNCTHVTASISFSLASQGLPSGFRKSACVRLHSESSEPTMFSQTAPDEHPPMPPPCRWPAVTTSPTLAKFQLVWRRFCDVVVFPSSLIRHSLTTVSSINFFRSLASKGFPSGYSTSVCPTGLRKLRTYDVDFSNDACRTPPDATTLPMAISHHFTHPRQVSARLAPPL